MTKHWLRLVLLVFNIHFSSALGPTLMKAVLTGRGVGGMGGGRAAVPNTNVTSAFGSAAMNPLPATMAMCGIAHAVVFL